jgi:acyl-CoA reductase-like NAD-dependent aldehyde dehydrogenase
VNDRAQPLFQQTRSASSARPRPCASRRLGAGLDDARRDRVEALIAAGVTDGATVLVDGRKAGVAEQDDGFFVGATVLDHVAPDMVLTQTKVVVERWS